MPNSRHKALASTECLLRWIGSLLVGILLLHGLPASAQTPPDSAWTVRQGDTLYSISREVDLPIDTLRAWNDLEEATIQVGQTLRLHPPSDTPRPTPASPRPQGTWAVRPGDTFVTLALRIGTTADTLFAMNDSTTVPLTPGDTLRLPPRFAPPTHVVRRGDTLYRIAGRYGVSLRALQHANRLDTTALSPGQRLRIPGCTGIRPSDAPPDPDTTGTVDVFPATYAGRLTASGAAYDPADYVASHPSLPFGSVVLLSNPAANTYVFARIVDRGPLDDALLMDVSDAISDALTLSGNPRNSLVAMRVVWIPRNAP